MGLHRLRNKPIGRGSVSVVHQASPTHGGMKLCPIHRTSLFLSDGWESAELHNEVLFC
jgi:hypothetical protein